MITALASLALLVAATPAPSDPVSTARVKVSYADLNLQTTAGRAELDRRLARAVKRVCPAPDHRLLSEIKIAQECRAEATANATRQRDIALASAGFSPAQIASIGR